MTIITGSSPKPPIKGISYEDAVMGVFYRKIGNHTHNHVNIYLYLGGGAFFLIDTSTNTPHGVYGQSYFIHSRLEPIDFDVTFKPD